MAHSPSSPYRIFDTGLSVVREPEGTIVADIVFIHGLQGHPYKTWAWQGKTANGRGPSIVRYWPGDLLPSEVPGARILAWGYDTMITKKLSAPSNKNNVLSHAKDLLFTLGRERPLDRRIIFVAHSLGGIVVKEMLANSAISEEQALRNIVQSTAAIIFLGTPHRGSPEMTSLGETARKIASSLFAMDTSPAALDALGLRTSDLERCQESFSRLWREFDFTVKTFYESLGLTGVNIGPLSKKVVPNYSSIFGDPRERAESLQANHMDMCRFTGNEDPNYRKVAGELRQIHTAIEQANGKRARQPAYVSAISMVQTKAESHLSPIYSTVVDILRFPRMNRRLRTINEPVRRSCQWLFQHPTFMNWRRRENVGVHHGLLWIRGKPGSGKSTLLRESYREIIKTAPQAICCVHFFNAKGGNLEHNAEGLYRSLLSQLLSTVPGGDVPLSASLAQFRRQQMVGGREPDGFEFPWNETEIRKHLVETINNNLSGERLILLIDALDECDPGCSRDVAYFLRDLTDSAYESRVRLDVCFSSRHFPFISLRDCLEICVEDFNAADIALFVDQRLSMGGLNQQTRTVVELRNAILAKAAGVFLWVVLVIDRLLRDYDNGMNVRQLVVQLNDIPTALSELFTDLLSRNREDAETTVRFFQWAILGSPNLRLREWRHILAFVRCGSFTSLKEWQLSRWYPENDEQLERQIQSISMGLVEVAGRRPTTSAPSPAGGQAIEDDDSIGAGAGSLVEEGETRTVQVVHHSVREYFLCENGFLALDPSVTVNAVGLGHAAIIHSCFDYMALKELDSLVAAREKAIKTRQAVQNTRFMSGLPRPSRPSQKRSPSVASFGSAGSDRYSAPPSPRAEETDSQEDAGVLDQLEKRFGDDEDLEKYRLARFARRADMEATDTGFEFQYTPAERAVHVVPDADEPNKEPTEAEDMQAHGFFQLSHGDDGAIADWSWLDHTQLEDGSGGSEANSVVSSMVLEADLPLLTYSTTMPIPHARHAEAAGVNQQDIALRLADGKTWRRWQLLREDIDPQCTLAEYLTEQNMEAWLPPISEDDPCDRFLSAAWRGNKEMVARLVRHDLDQPFYPSQEPLLHRLIAAWRRQQRGAAEYLECLKELLVRERRLTPTSQLPVSILSPLGHTPLCLATEVENKDLCMRLLDLGADVNARNGAGQRPLEIACSNTNPSSSLIELLVKSHADLGLLGPDQLTPLQLVCKHCRKNGAAIARILLLAGAHVDSQGTAGRKPLRICCDTDFPDIELISTLLEHGASANAQDGFGQTALHDACRRAEINVKVIDLLLSHGCRAGARDWRGWTALHIACSKNNPRVAVVWRLIEGDRQVVCAPDNQGMTPLHVAIQSSNSNVVRTLIENGARVDAVDNFNNTPISVALARLRGQTELGDVIIAKTVVTAAERQGYEAAELAALREEVEVLGR